MNTWSSKYLPGGVAAAECITHVRVPGSIMHTHAPIGVQHQRSFPNWIIASHVASYIDSAVRASLNLLKSWRMLECGV